VQVAVGREVRERDAVVVAALEHAVPLVPREVHRVLVASDADADVMQALAVRGQVLGVHVAVVERLDQLPLHRADGGDRDPHRVVGGLVVLDHPLDVARVELVDVPRADAVVVDVRAQRGVEVADDDCDLPGVREQRLRGHPRSSRSALSRRRP
jgi:hypothetical protein